MQRIHGLFCFLACLTFSGFLHASDETLNKVIKNLSTTPSMQALSDEELSQEQGQALFNLSYLAPGQGFGASTGNPYAASANIGYYTFGIEAEVSINANIKNLQVGCGGVNGASGCDLDIQNFSLGCIANSAGVCVSLPANTVGSVSNVAPHTTSSSTVNDTLANQMQMKDFVLTNPFYQFAIRNPNSASTREVIGIRIGAANTSGPMSFNDIKSFSGYLSGKADITMQAKNNVAITNPSNWTLGPPWPSSDGTNGTLGLAPFNIDTGILGIQAPAQALRVDISGDVSRIWGVANSGRRFSQAYILNTDLYSPSTTPGSSIVGDVTDLVDDIEQKGWNLAGIINTVCLFGVLCTADSIINALYPILKQQVKEKISDQLAVGLLGPGKNRNDLIGLDIPYNLANVGALDINSPTFGLSVQSRDLAYPGYYQYSTNASGVSTQTTTLAEMPRGWAMYLPNAFTLKISQPLDVFTANILGGAAAQGNIIGLPAPNRNCWGTLTFC